MELAKTFYHASKADLPPGTLLRPAARHRLSDRALEWLDCARPDGYVSPRDAIYMSDQPTWDRIGLTEKSPFHIYELHEVNGPVGPFDLGWIALLQLLAEPEREVFRALRETHGPLPVSPEEACAGYWSGLVAPDYFSKSIKKPAMEWLAASASIKNRWS